MLEMYCYVMSNLPTIQSRSYSSSPVLNPLWLLQRCGQTGKAAQTEQLAFLQQALSTAGTYGTTIAHAECTLALCDALQVHFNPSQGPLTRLDPRPHLQRLLALLTATEQKLAAIAPVAAPMDSPVEALHSLRVMHARVLARLSRTHEAHAWADINFAEQDRLRIRGSFPLVQPAQATTAQSGEINTAEQLQKSAVPPSVVEYFLDSTEKAAMEEQGGGAMTAPPHELYAASYACSAAALCGIGTVAVDCDLVKGAVPILMAERATIEERLLHADLQPGLDAADSSAALTTRVDPTASDDTGNEQVTEDVSMHASEKLDEIGFKEAQGALDSALSAAVCMHDWPRAVHAAEGLLHLSSLPEARLQQNAAEKSSHVRTPAEVLALWQSCRAMLQDSVALTAQAPQHHTACVLQRLLQLRQHPVNVDCEPWCADMEAADNQSFQEPSSTAAACADSTSSPAADVNNTSVAGCDYECRGRKSHFINYRAAAMLLQPASTLLSFSVHVSTVVLDFDTASSTVHACSLRKASDDAHQALETEYCHATIDATALEAVSKRVERWEKALAASMQEHQDQQGAPDAPAEGSGSTEQPDQDPSVPPETEQPTEGQQEQGDGNEDKQENADSVADAPVGAKEEQGQHDDAVLDLREEWHSIITAMEQLLTPVAKVLDHAAAPPYTSAEPAPASEKPKKGGTAAPAMKAATTVLLCVGSAVAQLPLEALSALQTAGAVCRDRGMHFAAARSELARGGAESADSSLSPVSLAKAAYGVSVELQEQFSSTVQQPFGPEWQGDVYRTDRTVAQEHHLVTATEHEAVVSALTDDYCATVHKSTVCCMDLESTKLLVILDRLKHVKEVRGPEEGSGADGGETNEPSVKQCTSGRAHAVGSLHHMQFEARMCMLLQRGISTCVSNRWPVPSDVGIGTLAGALKEQDIEFAVALRKVSEALGGAEPWHKYAVVVYGVPTVMVKTGTETSAGKGKKK